MKEIIFFVILISILVLSSVQAQYPNTPETQPILDFFFRVYKNDTVELIKLGIDLGVPFSNSVGEYKVRIISTNGTLLNESRVDVFFLYNKVKKDGVLINSSTKEFVDVYLSLPYYSDASSIELYHFDNIIYRKVIPEETLAYDCGNKICDPGENTDNCPYDCLVPIAPIITQTTTTTQAGKSKFPLNNILIFTSLILVIIFIALYFNSKRVTDEYEKLKKKWK